MKKITVVIPTYNRKDYLYRLLVQLNNQVFDKADAQLSILVVVDGSTDGTIEMLETEFPGTHIVKGNGNWWWTKSINEGCKLALKNGSDAVLLMNDDTEIDDNYLDTLLKKNKQHPDAIIGSINITREKPYKIYFSGVKKIAWWRAKLVRYHRVFTPYDEHLTGLNKSVALLGRGMFIPVSVFEKIGFFDEKALPQYKADFDFSLTAHENNIKTFISWDSVVYSHMELTGKGATFLDQGFRAFLASFFKRNTYTNLIHSFRYYKKHCPIYLFPFSFVIDKLRLIYSYWQKRKYASR
ncbi:MAG: glycosyltransferase [Candidatus Aminicenantes bacterium]|nr:glycosyltransferase [Candidatus Aminicenantes bacterium]NIM83437.1 glycosyltransferase [Candidatus Aminicenantes bacterium]NIN22812.1 glycosyltransferase [Candidatus Aminicenantes bacterium]NIN46546.1 glycosyltransferase [Candidatus Aminicenantes bacterium]NIN89451.1 glycosyltransferase [Candidatus Aminicenantes bacterium]